MAQRPRNAGPVAGTEAPALGKLPESALVLADAMQTFLHVVRSLARKGIAVHVASSLDGSPGNFSRHLSGVHRLPSPTADPEEWAETLKQHAVALGVTMIIPCDDSSLRLLDVFREKLAPVQLGIPSRSAVALLADKAETRRASLKLGIPMARGEVVGTLAAAEQAAATLGFPMVLKPQRSFAHGDTSGKTMAHILRTPEELSAFAPYLVARGWIAEEFVNGKTKGVSVLARDGEILFAWQHRRIATASETGASAIRVGEPVDPALLLNVQSLAHAAKLHGVAMFEFIVAHDASRHVLLEVNPRFWGSVATASAARVDFPAMLWDLLNDRPVQLPAGPQGFEVRHHLDGEYTFRVGAYEAARSFGQKVMAILGLAVLAARLFIKPRDFDSHARDDPEPFFVERREVLGALWRGVKSRLMAQQMEPVRSSPQGTGA